MKKKVIIFITAISLLSGSINILAAQEKDINDMTLEELKDIIMELLT